MTKRKALLPALLCLLLLFFAVYRLSHPTGWSRDLLEYLSQGQTITGEGFWRDASQLTPQEQRAALSDAQVERVVSVIRSAKISDNRGFAGTTESGGFLLHVDGETVHVGCIEDTELQYPGEDGRRSVRMEREGCQAALLEILREALPDAEIPS